MNIALWIAQALLAAMFAMAGFMKSTMPKEKLNEKFPYSSRFSLGTIRLIGIAELLGAAGLIVPILTGIAPILTPVAAIGLAMIQFFAFFSHVKNHEKQGPAMNVAFFLVAVFIAYGRF